MYLFLLDELLLIIKGFKYISLEKADAIYLKLQMSIVQVGCKIKKNKCKLLKK